MRSRARHAQADLCDQDRSGEMVAGAKAAKEQPRDRGLSVTERRTREEAERAAETKDVAAKRKKSTETKDVAAKKKKSRNKSQDLPSQTAVTTCDSPQPA